MFYWSKGTKGSRFSSVACLCFILLITANLATAQTIRPSFDCKRANSDVDRLICAHNSLARLDVAMSILLTQARTKATTQEKKVLLTEQSMWLNHRIVRCPTTIDAHYNQQVCLEDEYRRHNYALYTKIHAINEPPVIALVDELRFADYIVTGPIGKAALKSLAEMRIDGGGQWPKGMQFSGDKNPVSNCREFWEAEEAITKALKKPAEIAMSSYLTHVCGSLKKIMTVSPARTSYIKDTTIADSNLLSPALLLGSWNETKEKERIENNDRRSLAAYGVVIKKISPNKIAFTDGGEDLYYSEIARGDFNEDGIEDILVFYSDHAVGGTYREFGIKVLTRTSDQGLLEVVTE